MNSDERFSSWVRKLEIIEREIVRLAVHRDVFWHVAGIINENPEINKPNRFYSWMRNAYVTDIAVGIRRQLDRDPKSVSLVNLLKEIMSYPEILTRERFVATYKRHATVPEELVQWSKDEASEDFSHLAGSSTYIEVRIVRADLERLDQVWKIVKRYVNKRIVHLSEERVSVIPDFEQLETCLDALGEILRKYLWLLTGSASEQLLPTPQYDVEEIFRRPWIK